MIKAGELRINNWIIIDNKEREPHTYEVSAHDLEKIEDGGDDCFPIKLTPEILQQCGFESKDMADLGIYIFYKFCPDLSINFFQGSIWIGEWDTKARYVHQLQNLFYCLSGGEELDINLYPLSQTEGK